MAGAKEIRRQIQSIKKTQKITRAMEMVSASKVRKAQDRMLLTRPYAEKIKQVINHLGEAHPEYQHKYLAVREPKRVGYIIISSDRGLCGGLNQNLFRKLLLDLKKWQQRSVAVDLCAVGAKATQFFKRYGGNIIGSAGHLGDMPSLAQLIGVVNVMFNQFESDELDAIYIANNTFVNTMQQTPTITQLLPIVPETLEKPAVSHWDYIYEMDAKELIGQLLKRYIESCVYQSVVENVASEHAARMVAMKNATENAGELINKLNLVYNKARQAAITKELAEIVAGSEAV